MVEKDIRFKVMAISSTIEINRLQMTSRRMLSIFSIRHNLSERLRLFQISQDDCTIAR
jgi:hypothetical protein